MNTSRNLFASKIKDVWTLIWKLYSTLQHEQYLKAVWWSLDSTANTITYDRFAFGHFILVKSKSSRVWKNVKQCKKKFESLLLTYMQGSTSLRVFMLPTRGGRFTFINKGRILVHPSKLTYHLSLWDSTSAYFSNARERRLYFSNLSKFKSTRYKFILFASFKFRSSWT